MQQATGLVCLRRLREPAQSISNGTASSGHNFSLTRLSLSSACTETLLELAPLRELCLACIIESRAILATGGLHVTTRGGLESHSFSSDRRCELQQYCLVRTLCRLRSLCGACISDIAISHPSPKHIYSVPPIIPSFSAPPPTTTKRASSPLTRPLSPSPTRAPLSDRAFPPVARMRPAPANPHNCHGGL